MFPLAVISPPYTEMGPAICVLLPIVMSAVLLSVPMVSPEMVFDTLKLLYGQVKLFVKLFVYGSTVN